MSSDTASFAPRVSPLERMDELFDELEELTGQRNAIDGRIVDIVAEIDHDGIWGATGARSIPALVAWKAGVIAERAADGSDEHYEQLAECATVGQLRTAIKLAPRPEPDPRPEPVRLRSISKTGDEQSTTYRITLPHDEAAIFDAALDSYRDALVTAWKHDHADGDSDGDGAAAQAPPLPNTMDGFMSLVEAGWDAEVARRPHAQRTTVVVHVDLESRVAALHLGPLLSDADRRFLTCDATCEVWFEREGRVIGSGRETRTVGRRRPTTTTTLDELKPIRLRAVRDESEDSVCGRRHM